MRHWLYYTQSSVRISYWKSGFLFRNVTGTIDQNCSTTCRCYFLHIVEPLPSFVSEKLQDDLLITSHVTDLLPVFLISCKMFLQLSWKNTETIELLFFMKMVKCLSLNICCSFLCDIMNKIQDHEICKSLHSVFIYTAS